ncbi:MAG: BON domain-containing protein [Vicinamibacterales bacterium]
MTMTADRELIDDVLRQIERDARVDVSRLEVQAVAGRVTLTGSVAWTYQSAAAECDAKALAGVAAVTNQIVVQSAVSPRDVEDRIADALHGDATDDAGRIHVEATGRVVTLSGTLKSRVDKQAVERAAWRAPGVAEVRNRIVISP